MGHQGTDGHVGNEVRRGYEAQGPKRLSYLGVTQVPRAAQTAARVTAGRRPGSHVPSLSFLLARAPLHCAVSRPARTPAALTRSLREASVPERLTPGGRSRPAAALSLVPVKPSASTAGLQPPRNHSDTAPLKHVGDFRRRHFRPGA